MDRFIIVYDIPDDKRRTKLAKLLDDFGDRVQWSVFEVQARGDDLDVLKKRTQRIVDPEEDRVRVYPLCRNCIEKVVDWGRPGGLPFDEPDVIVV